MTKNGNFVGEFHHARSKAPMRDHVTVWFGGGARVDCNDREGAACRHPRCAGTIAWADQNGRSTFRCGAAETNGLC
jgi:hypothetical protein